MPDRDTPPDRETLREMRARVDELEELTAELRDLGDEAAIPAVERTAKRLQGTLADLDRHLPPELLAADDEGDD